MSYLMIIMKYGHFLNSFKLNAIPKNVSVPLQLIDC